jgi:Exopolysaccharide synthesis, ExoD
MTVAEPRSPGGRPFAGQLLGMVGDPAGMRHSNAGKGTGSNVSMLSAREKYASMGKSQEMLIQDIPADTKNRGPSSRVLQEVIRQAPAEYVTVGWLTSTLHPHSFGIIMLSLGLLAMTPVGSTVPGLILVVMAAQLIVGRAEPVFPHFIMTRRLPTKQLLWLVAALFMF